MFYLSGRGNCLGNGKTDRGDEFGWYLEAGPTIEGKVDDNWFHGTRSLRLSNENCVESPPKPNTLIFTGDKSGGQPRNNSVARNLVKRANDSADVEQIEMNSLNDTREMDLEMIENDAGHGFFTSSVRSRSAAGSDDSRESEKRSPLGVPRGVCYTPERLVRTLDYRILAPSPRYLVISRSPISGGDDADDGDADARQFRGQRRKIGDLIDSKQFGATHLEALLDPWAPEIRLPLASRRRSKTRRYDSTDELFHVPLEIANRVSPVTARTTPDLASSESSYERLESGLDERSILIRRLSREGSSGARCDEDSAVSESFANGTESKNRYASINEVVSIVEGLEKHSVRAAGLHEEETLDGANSDNDRSRWTVLSIETDGRCAPTVDAQPEELVLELRGRVEKLQEATRNILRDIRLLRQDFECNENRVDDLMGATVVLRQDTAEMRYLDDLLSLLDGELERTSRRNWPFLFGHEHMAEEMNLVV